MKIRMRLFFAVGLLSLISMVGGMITVAHERNICGTTNPSEADAISYERRLRAFGMVDAENATTKIVISVYFHVISRGLGIENGDVPDGQIKKQIKRLNKAFKKTPFEFRLVIINRIVEPRLFFMPPDSDIEREVKSALRTDFADELNIYSCDIEDSILGYATFPWTYEDDPKADGVVISFRTLPGGSQADYNEGDVATHEVGHWLGLYHTFQGEQCGPADTGDFVKDTPSELFPAFTCARRDSCLTEPGFDPIHNFMDYTDDRCKGKFTQGQADRMYTAYYLYRLEF